MNSPFISFSFTHQHVQNGKQLCFLPSGEPHPATKAITLMMIGTQVWILRSRETMAEVLYRMVLLFGYERTVGHWLAEDYLFRIKTTDGVVHEITLPDLVKHIGLGVAEQCRDTPRDKWLAALDNNRQVIGMFAAFGGIMPNEESLEIAAANLPDEKASAEIWKMVLRILEEVPEDVFQNWAAAEAEWLKTIDRYCHRTQVLKYDLARIPTPIKEQLYAHLDEYFELNDPGKQWADKLIYLAWLKANDFIYADDMGMWYADSIYELDPEDYELEDGGSNLFWTYCFYALDKLEPLLYENCN